MITREELLQILDYEPETGVFRWKIRVNSRVPAGAVAGTPHAKGYVSIRIKGRAYLAHRLAFLITHGRWAAEVDHINRNRADNRAANLREVTRSQNMLNAKLYRTNNSGYSGVRKRADCDRWEARRSVAGRWSTLGLFATKAEAVAARLSVSCETGDTQKLAETHNFC